MSLKLYSSKSLSDQEINKILKKILMKEAHSRNTFDIVNLSKLTKEWLIRYNGLYPPCYKNIIEKDKIVSKEAFDDKE